MWRAFSSAMLRVGNRAGTSSIEFALVALIFLFLLVAISDIARYLFMVQSMQLLATQTARATIVPFGTPNYLGLAPGCVSVGSAGLPFGLPAFLDPATTQLCMAPTDDPRSNANVVTITVEAALYCIHAWPERTDHGRQRIGHSCRTATISKILRAWVGNCSTL